jgi:hypothetical protein
MTLRGRATDVTDDFRRSFVFTILRHIGRPVAPMAVIFHPPFKGFETPGCLDDYESGPVDQIIR